MHNWTSVSTVELPGITLYRHEDYTIEDYTDLRIMKRVPPSSLATCKRLVSSALRKGEPWVSKGERHNGCPMEKATREMQSKVPSEQQGQTRTPVRLLSPERKTSRSNLRYQIEWGAIRTCPVSPKGKNSGSALSPAATRIDGQPTSPRHPTSIRGNLIVQYLFHY